MNSDFLRDKAIETQCVQAGYYPENRDPRVMPIVQSTTYKFDTADELGDVFDLKVGANMYTRLGNPTLNWLEEKIAVLEGGVAAVTTASGQSANLFAVINIAKAGEHVIAMSNLYGGTHTLFGTQLKKFGIDVEFVDPDASLEEMKQSVRPETRLIFAETIGNPALDVLDFEKVSALAAYADVPLVVDNTFPTPFLCRPFEHGAHIVTHSTTKYMDGHATSVGGVVVDSGKFNWNSGKYPELTTPDADYHGLVYTEAFGPAAFIAKTRAGLLRDIGSTMSPMNAFLTNLGLETLHLRMERHSENALAVAKYLEGHEKIDWVNYPGLESSKDYALAQKYLPKGSSGIVSFGPKGGAEAAKKIIDTLQLSTLVTHVGDIRSHTIHPASTTHRQLSEEQLLAAGVKPELIRLNVGCEHVDDIIRDLEAALSAL